MIFLELSTSDVRPIYSQIGDRVRFAVAAGVLRPGDLVPSVRELSKKLLVNPNTVARAYRDLQGEGLLEPVRGTGLQVAEDAPARCREARRGFVRDRLRAAIGEARQSGLDAGEIETILRDEWSKAESNGSANPQISFISDQDKGGGR